MSDTSIGMLDLEVILTNDGPGRRVLEFKPRQAFFCQGEPADALYYLQKGQARLTVFSQIGREAFLSLLSAGDFAGEESMLDAPGPCRTTATAVGPCTALRIGRYEVRRLLHAEPTFAEALTKFLLRRSMTTEADLVEQLLNSSQ